MLLTATFTVLQYYDTQGLTLTPANPPNAQVLQSAIWTMGRGDILVYNPPPIPLVYNTANLIGVDPSMRIPLCTIL